MEPLVNVAHVRSSACSSLAVTMVFAVGSLVAIVMLGPASADARHGEPGRVDESAAIRLIGTRTGNTLAGIR